MFGANSHRRRDRRQAERKQGHALTIRQTPTATPPRAADPCEGSGRNAPQAQNARELARKIVSVCITYNNAHGNRRRDAIFLQKWRKMQDGQPCDGHRRP